MGRSQAGAHSSDPVPTPGMKLEVPPRVGRMQDMAEGEFSGFGREKETNDSS